MLFYKKYYNMSKEHISYPVNMVKQMLFKAFIVGTKDLTKLVDIRRYGIYE